MAPYGGLLFDGYWRRSDPSERLSPGPADLKPWR